MKYGNNDIVEPNLNPIRLNEKEPEALDVRLEQSTSATKR
jgi:hypothetical protein